MKATLLSRDNLTKHDLPFGIMIQLIPHITNERRIVVLFEKDDETMDIAVVPAFIKPLIVENLNNADELYQELQQMKKDQDLQKNPFEQFLDGLLKKLEESDDEDVDSKLTM